MRSVRLPVRLRAHDPATLGHLVKALVYERDGRRRRNAARALGHLGPLARVAVYDLAAALDDGDECVRSACAHALGRFGPAATSAVPHLTSALRDPCPSVRAEAAVTLTAIWNAMVGAREGALGRR